MNTLLMSAAFLVLFGAVVQILLWMYNYFSLRKKMKLIPGPANIPFIGIVWDLRNIRSEDMFIWMMDLCFQNKNGILAVWFATQPAVHVRKPHQVEVILRSQTLIRKSKIYDYIQHFLGNGLLTSAGDQWHRSRRLITPAFHFAVLDGFAVTFTEKADVLNECIKLEIDKNPKKLINIYPLLLRYTLDTVCNTVMGLDMDIQRNPVNEYFDSLHRYAELTIDRYMSLLNRYDIIFNQTSKGKEYRQCIEKLHAFTIKVINEKTTSRKQASKIKEKTVHSDEDDNGKSKKKSFLDLLMDLSEADENPLSAEQLREQVDTFMFGGHDTTGVALNWIIFCIGNNPEVQEKVHEEIDYVFGNDNDPATKQQLSELKYLDRVVKEALRLYPSAPIISRHLDHDVTIDNYDIPKGIEINLQIYQMHHDPEVWEDPEKFDPDRFLPENSHGRHPYAYVPFSAGPRNCIGQKFAQLLLKVSLTAILRKWEFKSELKPTEVKINPALVLTPYNETMNVYVKARKIKN